MCFKPFQQNRARGYLYVATEYIEGQDAVAVDDRQPGARASKRCAESSSRSPRGLQAFHRLEMLHQDLRPDNVMIDKTAR
jgi:serine/threonine protein kinase